MKSIDGRHKLAILGAVICWALSVWFSYLGFRIDSDKIAFVGWILAFVVTIVELVFNSQTGKLSLTLIVTGILCYAYGIWTNITGFWSLQHPGVEFVIFNQHAIMPAFVGIIMEVLPEPLLMWGLMSNMDGDFLGNMIGLWNGKLSYAQPNQSQNNQSTVKPVAPKYTPSHKPNFNNPIQKYPTQHKVTMPRGEDEEEMMSRAA
jgi:hypothetical protein